MSKTRLVFDGVRRLAAQERAEGEAVSEIRDIRGYPILPGDLLRSFHYKHGRRNCYLYHVAAIVGDGDLRALPAHWLNPGPRNGGDCLLTRSIASTMTIVAGLKDNQQWFEREKQGTAQPVKEET